MLKVNIITLFPDLFKAHLENLPFKRAISNKTLEVNLVNLRDFALDSYGTVDDKPYGGGVGMILMIEPVYKALSSVLGEEFEKNPRGQIIALSPRGKTYKQQMAQQLSKEQEITFICGRYEGMDARIEENLATDVLSIGNYVLSGGELPALVIMESITRLLEGVLEKPEAAQIESFSNGTNIEYPQYSRPEEFNGLKVPNILLSGDHQKIAKWRQEMEKTSE